MKNPSENTTKRLGVRAGLGLPSMVLGLALLAQFSGIAFAHPSTDGVQRKVRKTAPAAPVEPEPVFEMTPVPPPPPPLTPGQMPPNAPRVSFEDGLLSIAAENSTLADILTAVKASTGATMDIPSSAGADRVWVTLGPGPARAVLADLLSGTSLDYVIQASDADQTQIQSVLLTPRTKGGKTNDSNGSGSQSFSSRYRQFQNKPNFGAPNTSDADGTASPDGSGASDPDASASSTQPSPTADAQPAAVDPPSTGTPSPALSARLPLAITESDAHPAPVSDTQQAIPQMQNLFEMRRQIQAQENAQQKTVASH